MQLCERINREPLQNDTKAAPDSIATKNKSFAKDKKKQKTKTKVHERQGEKRCAEKKRVQTEIVKGVAAVK